MAGSIDGNDLNVVRLDSCAECEGTDAAETVNADSNHDISSK